jgi:uncharacterized protein (TIGR02996 family)
MADHPGLIQAILDAPDDDGPRLIYADWLDDHGEALRAEFIRLHCRWEQFCGEGEPPIRFGVASENLRPEHQARLLAPLLSLGLTPRVQVDPYNYQGARFIFRRGLVEEIELHGQDAVRQFGPAMEEVFDRVPLRRLQFLPEFRPTDVEIGERSRIILPMLRSLAGFPRVGQLRELSFSTYRLGDAAAQTLLDSPYLRPETRLIVENQRFRPNLILALRERFGDRLIFAEEIPF